MSNNKDLENWNHWMSNERYMAMQRVKNIKDSHARTNEPRHPIIRTTAKAAEPFQTAVDQCNQPFRDGSPNAAMCNNGLSGGAISEEARKAIIEERSYYQRNKRQSIRVPEVDRQRIIKRLGNDYTQFNAGNEQPDPYNLDQSYRNPNYSKTEANLLLNVIETYVYNDRFNDELFRNIDKYFKLMWNAILSYSDFDSYDMLIKKWEDIESYVGNIHERNSLRIKRNRQSSLTPEGKIQAEAQQGTGFIYDYSREIVKFLEKNRAGIDKDMKYKKQLLKASIDAFKMPSSGFVSREIQRSVDNLSNEYAPSRGPGAGPGNPPGAPGNPPDANPGSNPFDDFGPSPHDQSSVMRAVENIARSFQANKELSEQERQQLDASIADAYNHNAEQEQAYPNDILPRAIGTLISKYGESRTKYGVNKKTVPLVLDMGFWSMAVDYVRNELAKYYSRNSGQPARARDSSVIDLDSVEQQERDLMDRINQSNHEVDLALHLYDQLLARVERMPQEDLPVVSSAVRAYLQNMNNYVRQLESNQLLLDNESVKSPRYELHPAARRQAELYKELGLNQPKLTVTKKGMKVFNELERYLREVASQAPPPPKNPSTNSLTDRIQEQRQDISRQMSHIEERLKQLQNGEVLPPRQRKPRPMIEDRKNNKKFDLEKSLEEAVDKIIKARKA